MSRLTNSNTWNALKNHQNQIKKYTLRDLFQDPNRFLNFNIKSNDFFLDFSKNIITRQTIDLLFKLAHESKIMDKIEDMFNAKKINWTEKRSVLHTALRDKSKTQILIHNKDNHHYALKEYSKQLVFPLIHPFVQIRFFCHHDCVKKIHVVHAQVHKLIL